MMLPPLCFAMIGVTACMKLNADLRFTLITASHCASVILSIVHKNVNTAEISHYLVNYLLGLLKVGSIGSISLYLVAESLEFLDGLLGSLIDDEIGESDVSSFRSILESYCLSNTSCSSCDESYFSI